MTPADLRELADRCEAAAAAGEFQAIGKAALAVFGWQDERYKRVLRLLEVGAFLDAAMSLVPEGWDGALYLQSPGFRPNVQLETEAMRRAGTLDRFMPIEGSGETLALALCAASLRARADHLQSEGNS